MYQMSNVASCLYKDKFVVPKSQFYKKNIDFNAFQSNTFGDNDSKQTMDVSKRVN